MFREALGSAAVFVSGLNHRSLACKPDIWRRRKDIVSRGLGPRGCFCVGLRPPFVGMQARHWRRRKDIVFVRKSGRLFTPAVLLRCFAEQLFLLQFFHSVKIFEHRGIPQSEHAADDLPEMFF